LVAAAEPAVAAGDEVMTLRYDSERADIPVER
jgi:hypothetical protein